MPPLPPEHVSQTQPGTVSELSSFLDSTHLPGLPFLLNRSAYASPACRTCPEFDQTALRPLSRHQGQYRGTTARLSPGNQPARGPYPSHWHIEVIGAHAEPPSGRSRQRSRCRQPDSFFSRMRTVAGKGFSSGDEGRTIWRSSTSSCSLHDKVGPGSNARSPTTAAACALTRMAFSRLGGRVQTGNWVCRDLAPGYELCPARP